MARQHLTADELEARVDEHLMAGFGYSQAELDAGAVSPEDRKGVRERLHKILEDDGVTSDMKVDPPEQGTWEPA
jgi:hypothetical protein